jgi:hypothetical protein
LAKGEKPFDAVSVSRIFVLPFRGIGAIQVGWAKVRGHKKVWTQKKRSGQEAKKFF